MLNDLVRLAQRLMCHQAVSDVFRRDMLRIVETTRDETGRGLYRRVCHGGYTGRDRANMWFWPESGWETVIVCNDGDGHGAEMGQVFHELLLEAGIVKTVKADSR